MKKIIVLLLMLFPFFVNAKEIVKFDSCVDGDTFKIILNDEKVTVRMLAIDTPETVHPTKEDGYYGVGSSEYTCNSLKMAKKLELEYDSNSDKYDKYNRILAWVFVDDYLLQDNLVKYGYAEVAYLYGEYKYTDILKDHQEIAKAQKLGIWSENKEDNSRIYTIIGLIIVSILATIYKNYKKKLKKKLKKSKINLDF